MKIMSSIFCSLIIATVISIIKSMTITDKKMNKLINEGIKRGQTVKAKLIKSKIVRVKSSSRHDDMSWGESKDEGIYQYEFNGKTYKRRIYAELGQLRKEIDLVHTQNLGKLYRRTRIYWFKYFIISLLIMLI